MTLLDKTGTPAQDHWTYWQEGQATQAPLRSVVRLDQWNAFAAQSGAHASGLWVAAGEEAEGVMAVLGALSLIVIEFPKARDGRGFTLARLLRERHRFAGDLRAAGPLLPDQFPMLLDCGFTSLLAPPGVPLPRWRDVAQAQAARQSKPRTLLERLSRNHQVWSE